MCRVDLSSRAGYKHWAQHFLKKLIITLHINTLHLLSAAQLYSPYAQRKIMSEAQERSEQKGRTQSETDLSESSQELRDGFKEIFIEKSLFFIHNNWKVLEREGNCCRQNEEKRVYESERVRIFMFCYICHKSMDNFYALSEDDKRCCPHIDWEMYGMKQVSF